MNSNIFLMIVDQLAQVKSGKGKRGYTKETIQEIEQFLKDIRVSLKGTFQLYGNDDFITFDSYVEGTPWLPEDEDLLTYWAVWGYEGETLSYGAYLIPTKSSEVLFSQID
jgi:hypothetical protein